MSKLSVIYDRSRVPLYLQVASVMRQRIEMGFWKEGEKISTLEELEKEFHVARVTIRQAVEILREEGLLDSQQGRGTFVAGKPKRNRWFTLATDFDGILEQLKSNVLKDVSVEDNGSKPNLEPGEGELALRYTFIRSVQYNDGSPFSVVNLHLDREIYQRDSKRFQRFAALPALVEFHDITIAHAYQTLTIGVADPETADLLKIGLGEPVADCHLVIVDERGIAIYSANIHYIKNCFAIRSDLLVKKRAKNRSPASKRS